MTSWPGPSFLLFSRWSHLSLAHSPVQHLLFGCEESILADRSLQSPTAPQAALVILCPAVTRWNNLRTVTLSTFSFGRHTEVVGTLCTAWPITRIIGPVFLYSRIFLPRTPSLIFLGKCRDVQDIYYRGLISDIVLGVVMFCMPLSVIWLLLLSRRKKFGCCGVCCLGALGVYLCSCDIFDYIYQIVFRVRRLMNELNLIQYV